MNQTAINYDTAKITGMKGTTIKKYTQAAQAATMAAPTAPAATAARMQELEPEDNMVIMAGTQDFLFKCTDAFLEKIDNNVGSAMSGSFGTVERIIIDDIPYYAKFIDNKVADKRLDIATKTVMDEINVAIYLTQKIPNYASNLVAAYITIPPDERRVMGFMVFEAPNGMNLEEFIRRYPPNNNKYARAYDTMYCLVKRAQVALNKLGYVHRDIKPANIYVILDDNSGQPINCKLIDFGLTVKEGYGGNIGGSPFWMPANVRKYMDSGDLTGYKASHTHNDYSTSKIWSSDFKQGNRPEPNCGLGAKAEDPRALIRKMAREAEAKRLEAAAAAEVKPKKKWWQLRGGKSKTKKHRANKKSKSTRRRS